MYKVSIDDLIGVLSFDMYKWYTKIGHSPAYPGKVMNYILDKHTIGFIYYGKLSEGESVKVNLKNKHVIGWIANKIIVKE